MEVHNTNVNYIQYGRGKDIVLLHGWGQNIEMMQFLGDPLSNSYRITILDFPGFGESEEPQEVWNITDYANMLHELLTKLKIENPTLIGHSFGGRVAIRYAAQYPVEKLVLLAPLCHYPKKQPLKVKALKAAKNFLV